MNINEERLPVVEMFYSLQGEGCHSGKAAFFVRLGGCDIHCEFCDSKSTWDARRFPLFPTNEIVERALESGADTAIVTGGEPLIHNLDNLCALLKEAGIACFLETSASCAFSGEWDWVCISPKPQSPPSVKNLQQANELKIIIKYPSDFDFAEEMAAMAPSCLLFLQPEWSVAQTIIPVVTDYVKRNPQWLLSLQMHKYIDIQ
jgi:organic radical activating enzyme